LVALRLIYFTIIELMFYFLLKVEDECGEIPTVLVQNKIDLLDEALIEP